MFGKEKCRILKEIRRQIAAENDINLVIEECTHKGDCKGTCPRCESEVAYLERELAKRAALRKHVALAGISVGTMLTLTGCSFIDTIEDTVSMVRNLGHEIVDVRGSVEPYPGDDELDGDIIEMGEVEYIPERDDDIEEGLEAIECPEEVEPELTGMMPFEEPVNDVPEENDA